MKETNKKFSYKPLWKLLIKHYKCQCKKRGVHAISLEATDMGKPLYVKFGFVKMNDEMELLD